MTHGLVRVEPPVFQMIRIQIYTPQIRMLADGRIVFWRSFIEFLVLRCERCVMIMIFAWMFAREDKHAYCSFVPPDVKPEISNLNWYRRQWMGRRSIETDILDRGTKVCRKSPPDAAGLNVSACTPMKVFSESGPCMQVRSV